MLGSNAHEAELDEHTEALLIKYPLLRIRI